MARLVISVFKFSLSAHTYVHLTSKRRFEQFVSRLKTIYSFDLWLECHLIGRVIHRRNNSFFPLDSSPPPNMGSVARRITSLENPSRPVFTIAVHVRTRGVRGFAYAACFCPSANIFCSRTSSFDAAKKKKGIRGEKCNRNTVTKAAYPPFRCRRRALTVFMLLVKIWPRRGGWLLVCRNNATIQRHATNNVCGKAKVDAKHDFCKKLLDVYATAKSNERTFPEWGRVAV